jgi:hypothetical protein
MKNEHLNRFKDKDSKAHEKAESAKKKLQEKKRDKKS